MKADDFPKYGYPCRVVVGLAFSTIFGLRRSFCEDAIRCIGRLKPPLRVLGRENIPQSGPCVITVNHYHRPGFGAEWLALGISAVVPHEMHWIMTAEWTAPGKWYEPIKGGYSRLLLNKLSRVYGYITMPPMPPRPQDVEARARSVKKVLNLVRKTGNTILGLAPEGGNQTGGWLSAPAPGAGRFGLLLAGSGSAFVPVGAYEADGSFYLHFGLPYQLSVPSGLSADEKDRAAAEVMMRKIAALLPEHLRGEFA
ncbi:MAG: hypothetical protein JW963_07230 [Anaerolineales bacterium]|nr:hypothetical protein [Anaerolineales bacterium]